MQEHAHLHGHIRCNFPEFFFQEMFVIDDKSIKFSRVEQEEFFAALPPLRNKRSKMVFTFAVGILMVRLMESTLCSISMPCLCVFTRLRVV